MASPITKIIRPELTEEEKQQQTLEHLLSDIAGNKDSLQETLLLLKELHESGLLEALTDLLKAKEKVAKIAVDQATREPVTNLINNAMAAGGALTNLDPKTTEKLMAGVASGIQKAEQGLQEDSKVKMFDLVRALNDPDINRAIGFGMNLLRGVGEGLKE